MGLGLSSSKKSSGDLDKYEWRATHACETNAHEFDGNYTDHASAAGYNFEKGLQLAADNNLKELGHKASGVSIQDLLTTDLHDFGDYISFAMWINPQWGHSGTTTGGQWSIGSVNLPLFQMNTSNPLGGDRSIFAYISFRSGTSFRNRITIWTDSGDQRAGTQKAMHDANSITGTGSSNSSVASLWDQGNPGNTNNADNFVHLTFTRAADAGVNAWTIYWNGQDIGTSADVGQGNDSPVFTDDTANFLGIGTYRGKTSNYDSGNTPYNQSLTPMYVRDFAVFNYELTSAQASALYNNGGFNDYRETVSNDSAFLGVKALPPVLYYPLNHNTLDYMKNSADLSGNISFVHLS